MSDGINLRNQKVSKDVGGCWRMWSLNGLCFSAETDQLRHLLNVFGLDSHV